MNEKIEAFFFFLYVLFFPQVLWYDNFFFHVFGNHLRICITSAVKKHPTVFISDLLAIR